MTDDRARFDQLVPDRIHPQMPGINRSPPPELKASLDPPRGAKPRGWDPKRSLQLHGGPLPVPADFRAGDKPASRSSKAVTAAAV